METIETRGIGGLALEELEAHSRIELLPDRIECDRPWRAQAAVSGDTARPPLGFDDGLGGEDGQPISGRPLYTAGRPTSDRARKPR
jgi:hypothetical protein